MILAKGSVSIISGNQKGRWFDYWRCLNTQCGQNKTTVIESPTGELQLIADSDIYTVSAHKMKAADGMEFLPPAPTIFLLLLPFY